MGYVSKLGPRWQSQIGNAQIIRDTVLGPGSERQVTCSLAVPQRHGLGVVAKSVCTEA